MTENELAKIVVDAAFQVHVRMGPGLLESVYRILLAHELRKRGLEVQIEEPVLVRYDNIVFEQGFRADLIVEKRLIVETKSVEAVHPVHKKQLLTYLRLTNCKLGLLINFNEVYIKDGISRVVNGLEEERR